MPMHRIVRVAAAILALVLFSTSIAAADDWVAAKLRGTVQQLVGEQWVALARNDVVSDDRTIRTGSTGRVTFQRGEETIELGANTEIRIHDRPDERFTTIEQQSGTVAIEADALKVKHFAVETPYIAAVVKGTKFVVTSDDTGSSVLVSRGKVDVRDRSSGHRRLVPAGEAALVTAAHGPMIVVGAKSKTELSLSQIKTLEKLLKAAKKASDKAAKQAAKAAKKSASGVKPAKAKLPPPPKPVKSPTAPKSSKK